MIDTHNHLLDGMDDGPDDRAETLEMCRIAWEDGIKTIVATPHAFDGRYDNEALRIRTVVSELNDDLASRGMEIRIMPGMEARISADLLHCLSDGRLLPLNGRTHMLLEFHPSHVPAGFENLVQRLEESGFSTILAHPEKNVVIQRNPLYLFRLLERFKPWTVLIQLTADSVIGDGGLAASRTAKVLLRSGLAHLIATDAHSRDRRPPRLAHAVEKAAKIVGDDRAFKMVNDIPLAIVNDSKFPEEWHTTEPKSWWKFW